MRTKKEKFQVEITLEDGQISDIRAIGEGQETLKVDKSLYNQFHKLEELGIMTDTQQGAVMLSGQNSPGWICWQTARGYICIYR